MEFAAHFRNLRCANAICKLNHKNEFVKNLKVHLKNDWKIRLFFSVVGVMPDATPVLLPKVYKLLQ